MRRRYSVIISFVCLLWATQTPAQSVVDLAVVSEQKGFVHHHHPSSFHHSIPMPSHITKWKMDTTKPTVNHFGTCT